MKRCLSEIGLQDRVHCSKPMNHKGKCRDVLSLDKGTYKITIEWSIVKMSRKSSER